MTLVILQAEGIKGTIVDAILFHSFTLYFEQERKKIFFKVTTQNESMCFLYFVVQQD